MKFVITLMVSVVAVALFGVEADMDAYKAAQAEKAAARYGYTVEEWNQMTPMDHLRIRREARAIKAGYTK